MNKNRRKRIKEAVALLTTAFSIVEHISDDEHDCLDNMPENLEYSERYEKMENAVDKLDDAAQGIQDVIDLLNEAAE